MKRKKRATSIATKHWSGPKYRYLKVPCACAPN